MICFFENNIINHIKKKVRFKKESVLFCLLVVSGWHEVAYVAYRHHFTPEPFKIQRCKRTNRIRGLMGH